MVGVSVAMGDPVRYAQIATLSAFVAAAMYIVAWLLRLRNLINFVTRASWFDEKSSPSGLHHESVSGIRRRRRAAASLRQRWPPFAEIPSNRKRTEPTKTRKSARCEALIRLRS